MRASTLWRAYKQAVADHKWLTEHVRKSHRRIPRHIMDGIIKRDRQITKFDKALTEKLKSEEK